MTVFGPMVNWGQSIGLKYPGNGFDWNGFSFEFELRQAGGAWRFERRGIAPLRGTPEGQSIPPAAGSANFGWPNYLPYPQWSFTEGIPPIHPSDIATCFPRFFRCRSMQLAETLRVPSSNHLIETSG